jgi:hypothetical protein
MKKYTLLCVLFLLICALSLQGQNILKGFVYESTTGGALPYCMIHLSGTEIGAMTDVNGAFIIAKIPNGEYVVKVSVFGHADLFDTISISGGRTLVKRYDLNPDVISLDQVVVKGETERGVRETRTAVISVTPKELSKMPSIGGQADFAQYLQVLPGIVSTGDQGGQLYVRGGTPIQNMLLLDGMLVINPFHSIGLFSVFDSDIIQSADVYTGGFGAEFGGRVSSVMNIQIREGNKKRISGKLDVNTFGAKMLLEGPIVKLKNNRKTSMNYILSAKGSYLTQSSPVFYPYIKELPYSYLDLYGKLSISNINGSKASFFGFHFDDKVKYSELAAYGWKNYGGGMKFYIVPGTVSTTIEGAISYSHYISALNEYVENYQNRSNDMDAYSANLTFNYMFGMSVLNVGFELTGNNTKYNLGINESVDHATDLSLFAKYKYNFKNKILFEPSFRLQAYLSQSVVSPEPRLAIKYNITSKIRLKVAGGLYSQNYVAISSDRDVVNLFSGYMSSVKNSMLPSLFNGEEMDNSVQKAQHAILGLELDVIKNLSVNIEGFYKNFSVITSANRYKMFPDESQYNQVSEILTKDYLWEDGRAYGADISLKYEYKNIYVWLAYTLSWVQRNDGVITYNPHFDRRHNLNLLASYNFGKRNSWQADIRWNFGSGFPFTKTLANYPLITFIQGLDYDYVTSNEEHGFVLSDLNAGRLPAYHRLDLSIKKTFHIGERHAIAIALSVTNVYNYQNIFYINRTNNEVIYQLPILYNIGLSWKF